MVIMKCTDVFRGAFHVGVGVGMGEGITWEDLSIEEFIMREENFHEGGARFSGIIKKKKQ